MFQTWCVPRRDDLAESVRDLLNCASNHLKDEWLGELVSSLGIVQKRPFNDAEGCQDGVVEQLVDNVDADAGLVDPVRHDGCNDLAARSLGGVSDR